MAARSGPGRLWGEGQQAAQAALIGLSAHRGGRGSITPWTPPPGRIVGAAVAILVAVGSSFRSFRDEMRTHQREMRAQGEDLRKQVEAQGDDLRNRLNAQSDQMGLFRERMAHLAGLLEGLREAITQRVA